MGQVAGDVVGARVIEVAPRQSHPDR
jgi:hypothetical protein